MLVCLLQRRRAKQAEHMREVERLLAFRRQLYQAMRVSIRLCLPVIWSFIVSGMHAMPHDAVTW